MKGKIAVVGMGQGGMVAAIYLARAGYAVTAFEKCAEGEASYKWYDDIRYDIFELTGLPMPSEDIFRQKSKWLFVSPNERASLAVPPLKPMEEISISRRGLANYFAKLLIEAGGEVVYNAQIDDLYIKNDRVSGIIKDGEPLNFDLVIDASGLNSPLRAKVPDKFHIQHTPQKDGTLFGYRAFFRPVEGASTLAEGVNSTLVLKHMGEEGISWCNLSDEGVDVLIGRINGLEEDRIAAALADLKALDPILGDELIYDQRVEICLRATISNAVADGYIAIGDSAYMTMPLMGSGIESSMKAGKLFADIVTQKDIADFTAQNMWQFFSEYMRKYGAGFAFIDILKRWALTRKPKIIDWVFEGGLIEQSDLALVSTDDSDNKPKLGFGSILKKAGILLIHPAFLCSALGAVFKALKAKRIASHCPKAYDAKKVFAWQKKYERLLG